MCYFMLKSDLSNAVLFSACYSSLVILISSAETQVSQQQKMEEYLVFSCTVTVITDSTSSEPESSTRSSPIRPRGSHSSRLHGKFVHTCAGIPQTPTITPTHAPTVPYPSTLAWRPVETETTRAEPRTASPSLRCPPTKGRSLLMVTWSFPIAVPLAGRHIVARRCTVARRRQNLCGRQKTCLLYTSPSPRDIRTSRMPSSA